MSQINDLDKLIASFTRTNSVSIDSENDYLIEEDCDDYIIDNDEENDSIKMTNLTRLFTTHLKELTLGHLNNLFKSKNLLVYIYSRIKYLAQKILFFDNDDDSYYDEKLKLFDILNCIESINDLIESNSSESTLDLNDYAFFFIMTLKASFVLFEMLTQMKPNTIDDNQSQSNQSQRTVFISSQITSINSSKFSSDLSLRLNVILIKLATIIEKKVNNFTDNKLIQIKLIYFLNKLLGDYLSEAKTMAFIWKLITKIVIKNRLFSDLQMTDLAVKSKNPLNNYDIKFVFNKLFYCIYKMTYYHLKIFKYDLIKQTVIQELAKLVKYVVFLFKILKTFVLIYQSYLNDTEAFYLLTNMFSLTCMILLQKDYDSNLKKFKFDFFTKEVAVWLDELIDLYSQNDEYLKYLNEQTFVQFEKIKQEFNKKFLQVYKINDTESYYDQVDYYEEWCLFLSLIINRASTPLDAMFVKTLENSIEFTSLCTRACNLPVEFVSFELFRFDLTKLNELNLKSDCLNIEFFDLILVNLFNYCMLNNSLYKLTLSFLLHNLTQIESKKNSIKIYMCKDLLVILLKKMLTLKLIDPLKIFQFLFEVYECSVSNSTLSLDQYEECLSEITRFYLSKFDPLCVVRLIDYLKEQKCYASFNLIISLNLKQLKNSSDYSVNNLIDYFISFFTDLSQFLAQQAKQIDQNLLKKLHNFLKSKNGLLLLKWISLNSLNLSLNQAESACKCLSNFFFKLDFIETYLKLFESFVQITETTSKQSSQIYDNFKYVFEFIFRSIRVWSELGSKSSNDSDKIVLIEFLQRYSSNRNLFDSNDSELNRVLFMFKYLTAYCFMLMLNNEIKDSNLRKKLVDLACVMSDDSNPIMRELLTRYLGSLASYDHVNSKLVVELIRSNTNIRELVNSSTIELKFNNEKILDILLIETNKHLLDEMKHNRNDVTNQITQSQSDNLNEITFDIGAKCSLDDTMNAIFAMDTTLSMDLNSSSQALKSKTDNLFNLIEENLNELIDNYSNSDKPRWLKDKLKLMFKTYSDKL